MRVSYAILFVSDMRRSVVFYREEPKHVFGVRIAQYLDPDGLGISVSEERSVNT
jgi:hypothetical protein